MHSQHMASARTSSNVQRSVIGVITGTDGAAGRQEALQQLGLPRGNREVQRRAALLR